MFGGIRKGGGWGRGGHQCSALWQVRTRSEGGPEGAEGAGWEGGKAARGLGFAPGDKDRRVRIRRWLSGGGASRTERLVTQVTYRRLKETLAAVGKGGGPGGSTEPSSSFLPVLFGQRTPRFAASPPPWQPFNARLDASQVPPSCVLPSRFSSSVFRLLLLPRSLLLILHRLLEILRPLLLILLLI